MKTEAKVVLITGAAKRIGACIARQCHGQGFNVIVHFNESGDEADTLCKALNASRENSAIVLQANLRSMLAIESLVEQSTNQWGRLDVLVNNASIFNPTKIGNASEDQWNDLMATNLKAPFFLSQCAIPHLKKTQGSIINITDIHADRPLSNYSTYCISKAGLKMMTMSLAKDLAPDIRVNAIAPGVIAWSEGESELSDAAKQSIIDKTPLKRAGQPEDIAEVVLFLIQDADYITGQTIRVSGGR